MRNLVMLAVAAGLVLPTAANAQRSPENRRDARVEADAQPRNASPEWRARLAARAAYAEQQQREARQDRREDRRDDRREAREDRRDDRRADRRDDRRDWRQDRREDRRDYRQARRAQYRDWRAYRQADRHAFRRGAYVAPRGYYYRPVRAGGLLRANVFWGSRYWIDPYDYYLPQPRYGYQRWIRYGNDVLLIDTRNGRVLTVYDSFFW
ncbi:RcnB family protein [Alteriqipengyuania sp. 357]